MVRYWLSLALGLGVCSIPLVVDARPADLFLPHLDRIRDVLPPHFLIRLPAEVLLNKPDVNLEGNDPLIVRVQAAPASSLVTVSLLTPERTPRLVGSFSVASADSPAAQQALIHHQALDAPITLSEGVTGYLQDGHLQNPPAAFSSVMWEQNRMIYTVRFLADERQNLLRMAQSMALESPIRTIHEAGVPTPIPQQE